MVNSHFSLRTLLALIAVIAVILALPVMLEPMVLACWLLALWRRTRMHFWLAHR